MPIGNGGVGGVGSIGEEGGVGGGEGGDEGGKLTLLTRRLKRVEVSAVKLRSVREWRTARRVTSTMVDSRTAGLKRGGRDVANEIEDKPDEHRDICV